MLRTTLFLVLLTAPAAARGEEPFPYVGYIRGDEALARSGPGDQYYPTDRLESGTKIEVYRHVAGGWCAIRPPLGSFNWVPAAGLKMTDEEDVAEVTGKQTIALVGSRVEKVRQYRWQIQLDRGELVEVLGVKNNLALDGGEQRSWCKISPPAGEFRWVKIDQIGRGPLLGDDAIAATQSQTNQSPTTQSPSDETQNTNNAFRDITSSVKPRGSKGDSGAATDNSFTGRLNRINLELSALLAEDAAPERFTPLLARAETMLEEGRTPLERGRARLLLTKIGQFERIQHRRQNEKQQGGIDNSLFARREPSRDDTARAMRRAEEEALRQRFDGFGWLIPLRSRSRGAPPYALVTQDNRIIQYVTPAPGVNLHRYLNKQVGIRGQRGYIRQLERSHLTAQRVKVLDESRLR